MEEEEARIDEPCPWSRDIESDIGCWARGGSRYDSDVGSVIEPCSRALWKDDRPFKPDSTGGSGKKFVRLKMALNLTYEHSGKTTENSNSSEFGETVEVVVRLKVAPNLRHGNYGKMV